MNKITLLLYFFFPLLGFSNPSLVKKIIPQFSKLKNSVVYIEVFTRGKIGGKYTLVKKAYGSGTILTKNGYLVTNYHVISHGNYFNIILPDGKRCKLERFKNNKIYLADQETDIAVLKLNTNGNNYTPVKFGDSSQIVEGEKVYAIGNPYGLIASVTGGIISSKTRNDIGFTQIEDFIQTDVPINPGNSGGPLINGKGEMIGINTAIRTVSGGYQGISFAIPSNMIKNIFIELVKYGRVRRGWLGILIQNTNNDMVKKLGGVKIVSIIKNSPAQYAGIKNGDIISYIDGEEIISRGKFMKVVKNKKVGSKLVLSLLRNGDKRNIEIILREKKEHKKIDKIVKRFFKIYGIAVEINSVTEQLIVSKVSPLKMYLHGNNIYVGDIIYSINGSKIENLIDFVQILKYFKYKVKILEVFRKNHQFLININNN